MATFPYRLVRMEFALVVQAAPNTAGSLNALRFARAALDGGHAVPRVFFYSDGVLNGLATIAPPSDETDPPAAWAALARDHGTELAICVAAGLRRGVTEASVAEGFTITGLGQLIDSLTRAERSVTFK